MTTRKLAGLITALLLLTAVVPLVATPALGDHIPPTGGFPANCVEFQAGNTGSKTVGDVTITLDSWADTSGDPHTVNFTISGLAANQFVDISVKSGTEVDEEGPYGNGSHSYDSGLQNAISHIRLCVFVDSTTTTTEQDTTTTTEQDTTTTTEQDTTTTTTTAPEVGPSTTIQATTTTVEPEVQQETTSTTAAPTTTEDETEDTLPFTGIGTDGMAMAAALALAAGAGLVLLSSRSNEAGRHSR